MVLFYVYTFVGMQLCIKNKQESLMSSHESDSLQYFKVTYFSWLIYVKKVIFCTKNIKITLYYTLQGIRIQWLADNSLWIESVDYSILGLLSLFCQIELSKMENHIGKQYISIPLVLVVLYFFYSHSLLSQE